MSVKSTSKKTARVLAGAVMARARSFGAGDGDCCTRRIENLRSRCAHVVDRDRVQQFGKLAVVVEAKIEPLAILEERRDAVVRFEQTGNGPDQIPSALVHLDWRRTLLSEVPDFNVNRLDGSFHVAGIDSGTNHQRPFAHVRVESTEGVIGHPLPFADLVGKQSSKSERPEDVSQHPLRVIAWTKPADGGEAVCNFTLRLARH